MSDPAKPIEFPEGADTVAVVDRIIREGIARGASDIHIEPDASRVRIRLRLDGVLQDCGELPLSMTASVVARVKVLADMLT